jgi:hypothetical protein
LLGRLIDAVHVETSSPAMFRRTAYLSMHRQVPPDQRFRGREGD